MAKSTLNTHLADLYVTPRKSGEVVGLAVSCSSCNYAMRLDKLEATTYHPAPTHVDDYIECWFTCALCSLKRKVDFQIKTTHVPSSDR